MGWDGWMDRSWDENDGRGGPMKISDVMVERERTCWNEGSRGGGGEAEHDVKVEMSVRDEDGDIRSRYYMGR